MAGKMHHDVEKVHTSTKDETAERSWTTSVVVSSAWTVRST
jgi:hypothetical protein